MTLASVVRVDGQNNVHIEIAPEAFARCGVEPGAFPGLIRAGSSMTNHQVKLGAACSRYLGDIAGLGEDPRKWPPVLPDDLALAVVTAVPHAAERIELMRSHGKSVPLAVYS